MYENGVADRHRAGLVINRRAKARGVIREGTVIDPSHVGTEQGASEIEGSSVARQRAVGKIECALVENAAARSGASELRKWRHSAGDRQARNPGDRAGVNGKHARRII